MGEIMAGGLNESAFSVAGFLRNLERPELPPELKDPSNWPFEARQELGTDQGALATGELIDRVASSLKELRRQIDAFNPDAILIWSKEQMENFGEDCMPPFCIYAYEDDFKIKRKLHEEEELDVHIHREAGRYLATNLLDAGFDMAYSYKPLHLQLAHTFAGLISYLDWDKKGLPYPIIPFYVNSLGHLHLTRKGFSRAEGLDPPAPQPWRCFDLGAQTARILRDSPWRVVLLAGSAWSHASYIAKHHYLWPDVEFDRKLFADLKSANFKAWRNLSREELIDSGNNEFLSWVCLAGALDELKLTPAFLDAAETWILNSTKVTAVFK